MCVAKLRGMYQINIDVVEWANIPIIDISKASTPEGRAELAPRARDAMRTQGFLYIINHGYTQTQVRVSDISACMFARTDAEARIERAGL